MIFGKKYDIYTPMKWHIHLFHKVPSTNETAKTFPDSAVIVAECQSAGRGRYGRRWESPAGNLYLSAVVGGLGPLAPLMAFGAGIAVANALKQFEPRLKWPNDVLIGGKKVAGILLEQTEDGRLIIGIGVNVATCPPAGMTLYPTTCLENKMALVDLREKILDGLAETIAILKDQGFDPIRKLWLDRAVGMGSPVRVQMPRQEIIGTFKDLSPQGELVLETPAGTVHISAGDVFLI